MTSRPTVLVLAGADPSGGAGIAADILAIAAQGAHALPVITALTVQDNDRVYEVLPVDSDVLCRQVLALMNKVAIQAVQPNLPVVLDPVLASGAGDRLTSTDALDPLISLATVVVPNLLEASALCAEGEIVLVQAARLLARGCGNVLITGGHAEGALVTNRWFSDAGERVWSWPRLPGTFHGSGCTLASAIAGRLALGDKVEQALDTAQRFCHHALEASFAIAEGQRIPLRCNVTIETIS